MGRTSVEKVGTYVTNTGLMATYGGQFTLTHAKFIHYCVIKTGRSTASR
ncbi:hypothetical protein HH659_004831 [Escherichia coli]|nr:hypothetical protein [Escherichia coli]